MGNKGKKVKKRSDNRFATNKVQFSKSDQEYLDRLELLADRVDRLTDKEIRSLILEYREGERKEDPEILDAILTSFYRLLIKKVWKYKMPWISAGDLIHYGIEGLIEAVASSFKLESKTKFITYAHLVVERRMKDGLDMMKDTIRFPKNIMTKRRKIAASGSSNFTKIGSTDKEMKEMVQKMSVPDDEGFKRLYYNEMHDQYVEPVDVEIERQELRDDLNRILDALLTDDEKDVMILKFGISGDRAFDNITIARTLGINPDQIEKLYNSGLDKIRENAVAMNILKVYLN